MAERKLKIGTLGLALEDIPVGRTGEAFFPKLNIRERVYAVEDIRKNRDIIIVGANNSAKEHSPVEISYETREHKWQRVTEEYPMPITEAGYRDDYAEVPFTDKETVYEIGTKANEADPTVPKFEARFIRLKADQDCYVRFNGEKRVQHKLLANTWYEQPLKCRKIYVSRVTTDGTLIIEAFG